MQPPTEPTSAARPQKPVARGDEDELYRRHHRDLQRAVAHAVGAPRELIEDACQAAWAILLRTQPDRYAIFAWLRVVAIHEAYRLSAGARRDLHLERLNVDEHDWEELIADPRTLDDAVTALEALRTLASLPERQRSDLARRVVELLEGSRARADVTRPVSDTGGACLTVSQVAARYRVSRSWVYAHQRELGAMRLGDGPRARLRFDPKVVADAITSFDGSQRPAESPEPHRRPRRGVRLIEFEKLR